jgi:hypothetical protein
MGDGGVHHHDGGNFPHDGGGTMGGDAAMAVDAGSSG